MTQRSLDFGPHRETLLNLPPGLVFIPDFLTQEDEDRLLSFIRSVTAFGAVVMHGVPSRRRVKQFGLRYSFTGNRLSPAEPVPRDLQPLRDRIAGVAQVTPDRFAQVLLTDYSPGAGIGWHRDASPFGIVAGVSIGAECRMRFRNRADHRQAAMLPLTPRSLYLLTGEARTDWEHAIPPVNSQRFSITFRTLRSE
jgi:alkylated DNA repair dioxygenase AlkB